MFTFINDMAEAWLEQNLLFTIGITFTVVINAVFGAWMHFKNRKVEGFNIAALLSKTLKMIIIIGISYLVLEIIISIAGSSTVTDALRIAVQIATLLYPGKKILKNIFIFSKGEYPPQWIMDKIYNFEKSGDLKKFLNTGQEERSSEDIDLEDIEDDI